MGEQPGEGTLTRGPKLVTPSGVPVSRSSGGEAFVDRDGGLRALFVTGDDGLYAVGLDGGVSSESLTPKLQPEPSVPIRSLALERTPLGTAVDEDGGVQRARGYLVTSRNVYEWQYGGSPPRWSSRLLVLGGGEPVEVWFDSPRSALGRVGYSDGQIYTLPGGYQLAGPLGEGGEVLDFENLGGWPVALTTDGVFAAAWPLNDDGSVNNRFDGGRPNKPMDWHRLTLPAGVGQSPGKGGRLFVQSGELVEPVSGQPRPGHKLFLFLSDEVLELASFFP